MSRARLVSLALLLPPAAASWFAYTATGVLLLGVGAAVIAFAWVLAATAFMWTKWRRWRSRSGPRRRSVRGVASPIKAEQHESDSR
jgi:hypothetical protein